MAKQIRSEYIKSLMEERNNISDILTENTRESLRAMTQESINDTIRKILGEADEDETEVMNDVESVPEQEVQDDEFATEDLGEMEPENDNFDEDDEVIDIEANDDDDIAQELEQYKNDNGEFDLRSMDSDTLMTVYKKMDPNKDGIRIVKDGQKYHLSDEEEQTEYIIDFDEDFSDDIPMKESKGRRLSKRINEEECVYTDKCTHKLGMGNKETEDSMKFYERFLPNKKNGLTKKDNTEKEMVSYEIIVDPEDVFEDVAIEMDNVEQDTNEVASTFARHSKRGGRRFPKSWTKNDLGDDYKKEEIGETIRKINSTMKENKELKTIANDITRQLNETAVINASLSKIIKLISENATTKDEKVEIIKRFDNAKNFDEVNRLYETISNELKHNNTISKTVGSLDKTMANENKIVEKSLIKESSDLSKTLSLMQRMDKLK